MILPGILNSCCSCVTTSQSKEEKSRTTLETVYNYVIPPVSCLVFEGSVSQVVNE